MELIDIRVLRGPNFWSVNHKVIAAKIDIGKFEDLPSSGIEGFSTRLQSILPGLYDHHCSEGRPGGFLYRVKTGTWIGHIVEHIALELQSLAGTACFFGKTRSAGSKGVYHVVISYEEEKIGIYSLQAAMRIAASLANGDSYDPVNDLAQLKKIASSTKLGPSTKAIVNAATARGIPHIRLGEGSLVQLGYGSRQKRIDATITDNTSCISVDLASDKPKTKALLSEALIPVPKGRVINDVTELGIDHENILTRLSLDKQAEEILRHQHYTPDSVPPAGQKVLLRQTANLSQGGTAEDVTLFVHEQVAELARRSARIIGLDICGIDIISGDISLPVSEGRTFVIEVNAAPGFRMHTNPVTGNPRPVGEAVIDMLFPDKNDGRIPLVAITGTNGKTTTARLLAHIAGKAGHTVGLTTTEGIYIDDVLVEEVIVRVQQVHKRSLKTEV